ncbi:hypothetical protein EYF80_041885 [Liparis tanakae]|uniref:Uncharacterized protein n=1 Tax=Liparis tanakae TaxID=230148 RepID=A0A4Z2G5S5_9TELE|nr:hypothetical protein EYF80_041885 [Liparis tanakae]
MQSGKKKQARDPRGQRSDKRALRSTFTLRDIAPHVCLTSGFHNSLNILKIWCLLPPDAVRYQVDSAGLCWTLLDPAGLSHIRPSVIVPEELSTYSIKLITRAECVQLTLHLTHSQLHLRVLTPPQRTSVES